MLTRTGGQNIAEIPLLGHCPESEVCAAFFNPKLLKPFPSRVGKKHVAFSGIKADLGMTPMKRMIQVYQCALSRFSEAKCKKDLPEGAIMVLDKCANVRKNLHRRGSATSSTSSLSAKEEQVLEFDLQYLVEPAHAHNPG